MQPRVDNSCSMTFLSLKIGAGRVHLQKTPIDKFSDRQGHLVRTNGKARHC